MILNLGESAGRGEAVAGTEGPQLEIRQLRAFVALVDQGSFKAAARRIGLAQSTVSEALAALERTLGTAVVVRRRGSHEISLTEAGEALLPHARGVLAAAEAAQLAVAGVASAALTTVAIVANESVSTYVLPGVLGALRERWPRTRFPVTVATCHEVNAAVEQGRYDLGLLLEPGTSEAPAADRVVASGPIPLVLFASPAHPLARRPGPVPRDALVEYPLFLSDAAGDFHAFVRRYFEAEGLPGPALQPAGSVEAVKRGVLGDPLALGVLPGYAVAEETGDGRAVALRVHPTPPSMQLEAILSSVRVRHPVVPELLEAVRAALRA